MPVIAAVTAGVILLVLWLIRRRALGASAQACFPVQVREGLARPRRGQIRYDEDEIRLTGMLGMAGPTALRLWSAPRHAVDMERLPGQTAQGQAPALVRLTGGRDRRGDRTSLVVELDEADACALRAWVESGPSMAGHAWWQSGRPR